MARARRIDYQNYHLLSILDCSIASHKGRTPDDEISELDYSLGKMMSLNEFKMFVKYHQQTGEWPTRLTLFLMKGGSLKDPAIHKLGPLNQKQLVFLTKEI